MVCPALRPETRLAQPPAGAQAALRVNDFRITYRPDGQVGQYFSDISVLDGSTGQEVTRKTISVNDPIRFGSVVAYQTDWGIAAVQVKVKGQGLSEIYDQETSLLLPMADLEGTGALAGRAWGGFLPTRDATEPGTRPGGVSFVARDLQSVVLYGEVGKFVGVRRPGSGKTIQVGGEP